MSMLPPGFSSHKMVGRDTMKKRIEIAFLVLLVGAGCVFLLTSKKAEPPPAATTEALKPSPFTLETAIRNVTDKTIGYTIRVPNSDDPPLIKTIQPGTIDRFPTPVDLEIQYSNGAEDRVYSLDAGKPYCFRYDTNGLVEIYIGSHSREDVYDLAPFVPTPMVVVEKMLEMVQVTSRDTVYDLGCGDGRIVIMAARKYGARGVGIDLDEDLLREARFNASAGGVSGFVEFINQDVTKADISAATVVTIYLLPESNLLLRPMLIQQLRRGTRVVCHNYRIDGWEDREKESATVKDEEGEDHNVYLYIR